MTISERPTSNLSDGARTAIRRSEIGFIYQFHHLLPEFTALENVVLPQMINGLNKGEAEARATDLLEFLGLGDRLNIARASYRAASSSA